MGEVKVGVKIERRFGGKRKSKGKYKSNTRNLLGGMKAFEAGGAFFALMI